MHRTRTDIGRARWVEQTNTALVTKSIGKYISTMGFKDDGHRLFPEEAVFLVDADEIELVTISEGGSDERVMDRIEVFGLLGKCKIDLKTYTVYSVLREQRFHVYRHSAYKTNPKEWKSLDPPRVFQNNSTNLSSDDPKRVRRSEVEDGLAISFDVYKPQANFARSRLGKPDFSLVILSSEDTIPSVRQLRALLATLEENVPLRLAVVGDSTVTFTEIESFSPKAEMESIISNQSAPKKASE